MSQRTKESGTSRLDPLELAEAAVFADLTVGLCLVGWVLPLGGIVTAMAVAPMAALGSRHRLSTVVAGGVCAGVVSMLIGGVGLAANAVGCAVLGGIVGAAERHRWSRTRMMTVAAATVWPVVTAIVLGILVAFGSLRQLLLEQVTNTWRGIANILSRLHLEAVARQGDVVVAWLVDHWWVTVGCGLLVGLETALYAANVLARPTLVRLEAVAPRRPSAVVDTLAPSPVPVVARDVSYRYAGTCRAAVDGVSMDVERGEFVAVQGPNGSGKSTLARILAGTPPTTGTVQRPGGVGLGQPDGTAVVFQRPETQVLGTRVRDDVVWGLPPERRPDVDWELDRVGLDGFADRDTSTLSGGELQRLAVAAALAHQPALLISDETTAMIDAGGRDQLLDLLHRLRDEGLSVVHVTHREEETAAAQRVVHLGSEPAAARSSGRTNGANGCARAPSPTAGPPLIRLREVGLVYDEGSPWAHRALDGVSLDIARGEGLLVHGPNGSGKTSLAWILAGLLAPTEGTATLHGTPLSRKLDHLGLSFQHARLQLQRSTVLADIRAAAGADDDEARAALDAMGLDPDTYGDRGIDELSGGQQRRVTLAGLLAANPEVLVLDEPFAGLDRAGRADLVDILAELRRHGTTVVLVSHDLDDTDLIIDHTVALDAGRIVRDSRPPCRDQPDDPVDTERAAKRRPIELRLFRVLPVAGPLHRVWAGTKLVALVALALFVSLNPQWPTLALAASAVCLGLLVGRVPLSAAPRLPRWVGGALAISFAASLAAGGPPIVHLGPSTFGLGGAGNWLRATTLGATIIVAAALVSWTTPLADVTPALQRLTQPFARFRIPVRYWTAAVGLSLRGLPMLIDEMHTLAAARRMRAAHAPSTLPRWRYQLREPVDLLAAAAVTAARRAGEFADAIESRGGAVSTAEPPTPLSYRDAVLGAVVLATIAAGILAGAWLV